MNEYLPDLTTESLRGIPHLKKTSAVISLEIAKNRLLMIRANARWDENSRVGDGLVLVLFNFSWEARRRWITIDQWGWEVCICASFILSSRCRGWSFQLQFFVRTSKISSFLIWLFDVTSPPELTDRFFSEKQEQCFFELQSNRGWNWSKQLLSMHRIGDGYDADDESERWVQSLICGLGVNSTERGIYSIR